MGDLDLMASAVSAIQEASFSDDAWEKALTLIGRLLHSSSTVIALESKKLTFPIVRSVGLSKEAEDAYAHRGQVIDPVIAYVRASPTGIAYPDWFAIDQKSFDGSIFSSEFANVFDMRHCMQAFTDRSGEISGFLTCTRPARWEAYSEKDRNLAHAILPHIRHALRVHRHLTKMEFQRGAAFDVLSRLEQGIFLVSADLTIRFVNREGERLLRSSDGLTTVKGRLAAADPADAARLQITVLRAMAGGLSVDPSVLNISRGDLRRPVLVRVIPFGSDLLQGACGSDSTVFVMAVDPDGPDCGAPNLQAIFDLTPGEERVACLVAEGMSLRGIAGRLAVSLPTVKSHLQHIFQKTGTHRQAGLVALLRRIQSIGADYTSDLRESLCI